MKRIPCSIRMLALVAGVSGAFVACSSDAPDSPGTTPSAGGGGGGGGGRSGGGRPPALVVAGSVEQQLINDRLKAVGTGSARSSVSVVPLSGGILTEILATPGQQVEANDTLATLDNEEQQIAYDRAARELVQARADATRLEQLFRSNTITAAEVDVARAALDDARLAVRDAELTLRRRTIVAPINGIVGMVPVDPGNFINAQSELLTIDDRSELIVEFWVPERFANQVEIGQSVDAVALADPGTHYVGSISGIDSRIEEDSRTLPVRAILDNVNDKLRPGMSFELELEFPGQQYPSVNPLAIQWDSDGSFVWKITDGAVQRVPATIIQRNQGSVLIDAELTPDDQVVNEGVLSLRQGAKVRIEGQGQGQPSRQNGDGSGGSQGSGAGGESGAKQAPATAEAKPADGNTGS